MRTIWFYGNNENALTTIAEVVGEELINRNQNVELIVHSEVQEILGRGLKDSPEDKSVFTDRLGFLGNLLHKNNVFTLIVSGNAVTKDRKSVKETYGNYIQVSVGMKDELNDIELSNVEDPRYSAKRVIEHLINEKLIDEASHTTYSNEEEEEIRRRLEELGYV